MRSTLYALHVWTFWPSLALFVAVAAALWVPRTRRFTVWLLGGALVVEFVSAGARWAVTGHPPVFGTFENAIASSWAVGLFLLIGIVRGTVGTDDLYARLLGVWSPVLLVYGLFFPRTPYPLTISERSLFIDVHVLLAWASFTVLLAAETYAGSMLMRRAVEPDRAETMTVVRAVGLGFVLFTAMIGVGAVYSYILFSDFYRWEIVGTSAAAAWIGYGAVLHAYLLFGWRGRKLMWAVLGLLPVLLFVFWSWSLLSGTYHHFDLNALIAR